MTTSDIAELRSFFSGYFHEDWEADASGPDEVVAQFLRSRPTSANVGLVVAQINLILDSGKDDASIERSLLEELGCYYLPGSDGVDAREWLRHVIDLLVRA